MKDKAKKQSAIEFLNLNSKISTDELISRLESLDLEATDLKGMGILHHLSAPKDIIDMQPFGFDRMEVAKAIIRLNPKVLDARWNGLDLPIEWAVRHDDVEMFEALMPHYKDIMTSLVVDDRHIDDKESIKPTSILKYAIEGDQARLLETILQNSEIKYITEDVDFIINNYNKIRSLAPKFTEKLDGKMEQFLDDLSLGRHTLDFDQSLLIHRDANGNSLLHHASILGNEEVLKAILKTEEGKKCMFVKNNDGLTSLDIALRDLKYGMAMNLLRNVGFTKDEMTKALCIVNKSDLATVAKQSFAFGASYMLYNIMQDDPEKRSDSIFKNDLLFHALGAIVTSTVGLASAAVFKHVAIHVKNDLNNPNAPIIPIEMKFSNAAIISSMLGSMATSALTFALMK
jgi:ankyrin repeat protein